MTTFDKRKDDFERKYAYDEQISFAVEARTSKLFGLWAAEKLGLGSEEAEVYAKDVIEANLEEPGFDDIYRKVKADFDEKGVIDLSEHVIREEIHKAYLEAKKQLGEE